MHIVSKNKGKRMKAWQLTTQMEENAPAVQEMLQNGRIEYLGDGRYAVWSQEAAKAGIGGEKAAAGDYVKVDGSGAPYPVSRQFFEENHRRIEGEENLYEQIPQPFRAWNAECGEWRGCKEVAFLVAHKGLVIDPSSTEHRYTAPLWGTIESADADAMILFYSVTYDENGEVTDADFNFVANEEFMRDYHVAAPHLTVPTDIYIDL